MSRTSLYKRATEAQDQRMADAIFEQLVQANMQSAGSPRTRKEAEAIERRNLAHFVAHSDDKTRSRVAKLFRTAKMPVSKAEKSSVGEALPRPGPRVTTHSDYEDSELSMGELSRLLEDPAIRLKFVKDATMSETTIGYGDRPRRDRWRPWVVTQENMPETRIGWRPMDWIEV